MFIWAYLQGMWASYLPVDLANHAIKFNQSCVWLDMNLTESVTPGRVSQASVYADAG